MTPQDLRRLSACAERGGADHAWLEATIGAVLELYLGTDPRRIASIEKARQIRQAIAAGATPEQVKERFGVSRSTYYRLRAAP